MLTGALSSILRRPCRWLLTTTVAISMTDVVMAKKTKPILRSAILSAITVPLLTEPAPAHYALVAPSRGKVQFYLAPSNGVGPCQ